MHPERLVFGIYGKGDYWRAYFRSFREKKIVRIYGSGKQLRQDIYEDDMARALLDSLTNPVTNRKIYNLAGARFTLVEYLRTIRRLTASRFVIVRVPLWLVRGLSLSFGRFSSSLAGRLSRIEASCRDETMDIEELRRDTGFEPTPIAEGLGKVIAHLSQGAGPISKSNASGPLR